MRDRKREDMRKKLKWNDKDLELLKSIYRQYTNDEIIEKYFPNRTHRALESIASKYSFNHKDKDAINRGLKCGAIKNPNSQKGKAVSDIAKHNMSIAQHNRYKNPEQREIARQNAIKGEYCVGDKCPIRKNPLYGKSNGRWNGGSSELVEQLRREILDWKKKSSEFCEYKCVFTGKRFQNIHHIKSFNLILEETLNTIKLDKRQKVSDYSEDEFLLLKSSLINAHIQTYYGACLCKELHELFHKEYTYFDSTINDFINFSNRIINGYYDQFFKENNLIKNINYKYLDYLKADSVLYESA